LYMYVSLVRKLARQTANRKPQPAARRPLKLINGDPLVRPSVRSFVRSFVVSFLRCLFPFFIHLAT